MAGATTAGMMLVAVILSKVILAGLFYGERAWLGREYTYQIVRFLPKGICSSLVGGVVNLEKDKKVEKSRKKSIEISLPRWYNILDNGMESLWKRAIPGRFARRFDSSPMRVEVLCGSQKISR